MKLKFIDIDKHSKLPKELNYIIFKYSTDICRKCNMRQKRCYYCKEYYCLCDDKYNICYLCKTLLCHSHINKISNTNPNLLCDICWEIDDYTYYREEYYITDNIEE